MAEGRRWGHGSLALAVVPLVALCALGATWRYAVVAATTLIPFVVLAVQLRRGTCTDRPGWFLMLAGTAVLVVHNAQNVVALAATGRPALGAFAASTLAAGFVLLLAGGLRATVPYALRDAGGLLDAALIGLAAASLLWGLVLRPAHRRLGSSPAQIAYEMSLVLIVAALTGTLARAAAVAREARPALIVLLLAMVATILADATFTLTLDPVTQLSTWWASGLCVVALLAFAAGLVHPTVPSLAGPERSVRRLTRPYLAFLATALAVNPALAGVQAALGHPVDVLLLSAGSLLMVPLVVLRIGLLARQHAEDEQRLHDLALLDDLTGLPNRRALTAHLAGLLDLVAAGSSPGVVVLYLDLDGFKAVNDSHGHATGDRLLEVVAARVRACVRPADVVSRFGGDEFVVVLEGTLESVGSRVVAAVERALAEPVPIGEVVVEARASIGIATVVAPRRADVDWLLSRADAQMYRSKRSHHDEGVQGTAGGSDLPAPAPHAARGKGRSGRAGTGAGAMPPRPPRTSPTRPGPAS